MRFKSVMRWDRTAKILRLFRVFRNPSGPFDGTNYAWKFSVGLTPRIFRMKRELDGAIIVIGGCRLHYQRAYGGYLS